jgi:hypothetical protein
MEALEHRQLLSAVPYGASAEDTGEFMLGDVSVTLVLLESNGRIDPNTENWQPQEIAKVKQAVQDGLNWWENLLAAQDSVHTLQFHLDFTYADQPIPTRYEPISRPSDDYELWIEDFFTQVGLGDSGGTSARIRQFNHNQRLKHHTHWAFTIFVVDADQDADRRFDSDGSFDLSFAFAGGRFFVTTSQRPASTIAHETAHMFWAMDEYQGSRAYVERRGYYNTQNLNAWDGNPHPDARVRSLMDSAVIGYAGNAVSPSALEMLGWKDSDEDGIFDVLDVAHLLVGAGSFDPLTRQYTFEGLAKVQTLPNRNSDGTGNDMTINRIDRIEARFDQTTWQTVAEPVAYQAALQLSIAVPIGVGQVELRAIDDQSGVVSNVLTDEFDVKPIGWQNLTDPFDVNGDAIASPLDALLVINQLNTTGSRRLESSTTSPPFVDVNGDGYLSPVDALMVINHLNSAGRVSVRSPEVLAALNAEGEPRSKLRRTTADWAELVDLVLADALTSRLSARPRCSV